MQKIQNVGSAVWKAISHSGGVAWRYVRSYWRLEALLFIGFGLAYLVFGEDPRPGGTPKVVTAFVIPAVGLFVAAPAVVFLLQFLWSPFRNHRELCEERDALSADLEKANSEDEFFKRWLHLRHWANNWENSLGNEIRLVAGAIQRPDETFDIEKHFRDLKDHLKRIRDELDHLGQPGLKEKFPDPNGLEQPPNRQQYSYLVQEAHQGARLIAKGFQPPPPFEGKALDVALKMPMIYGGP